ncbi:MAG: glycerate kinase [Phycicoccus sp.]|nr:glycerate kinase [Phycicoccus sp.]NMM33897.1 glycerate kinase [Phycicoccus sp.]
MRVLIAPDCFTGTLTATQAAEAIAEGWRRSAPDDDLTLQPLSDGGPGFLDVLTAALGGATVSVTVSDPLRRPVPAAILMVDSGVTRTAYIESAQACGLHLLSEGERNPMVTSTYGVGELIEAAVDGGATRVVVGLGGSGTNDGGAGMLAALGSGDPEALGRGGAALGELADDALERLGPVRERLQPVELVLATDVDSPLLGLQGASAVYAAQKGATPQMAQQLEAALGHFTEVVGRGIPASRDLLSGKDIRLERAPGAGAAGGLGYGLMLLGAHRVSGVQAVLDVVGFGALVQTADLVITGEGTFDWQSLRGKVVAGVAEAALACGRPAVVIAGQTLLGRRDSMELGISGTYAVAENPGQVAAALADPAGTLSRRTERVATTWSPRHA